MFFGRQFVEALLRQMSCRCIGELSGYLRQSSLGQIPLLQFILAITNFEQGIGTLARLWIFVNHALKGSLSLWIRLVDVVGLAQPILSVVRQRTVRKRNQELLKRRDSSIVLTVLQQVEGGLIRGFVAGPPAGGAPAGSGA